MSCSLGTRMLYRCGYPGLLVTGLLQTVPASAVAVNVSLCEVRGSVQGPYTGIGRRIRLPFAASTLKHAAAFCITA